MRREDFVDGNGFELRTGRCGIIFCRDYLVNFGVLRFSEIIPVVFLVDDICEVDIVLRFLIDVEQRDVIVVIWDGVTAGLQCRDCISLCIRLGLPCIGLLSRTRQDVGDSESGDRSFVNRQQALQRCVVRLDDELRIEMIRAQRLKGQNNLESLTFGRRVIHFCRHGRS